MIETAVSLIYSPRAENKICELYFRDGTRRKVTARELASGRLFEQICRTACHGAFLRSIRGGDPGICVVDIEKAVAEAVIRLRTTLSPRNAHAYLQDLPQDLDVVRVEPISRRVDYEQDYLIVNVA